MTESPDLQRNAGGSGFLSCKEGYCERISYDFNHNPDVGY